MADKGTAASIFNSSSWTESNADRIHQHSHLPLCVIGNATQATENKPYFQLFELIISLILLFAVALPGLVGNSISMFILSRPQMKTSLNVILMGLTSFDSILLITSVLLFVQPTICTFVGIGEYYFKHVHPIITPYIYLLAMTSQTSSVYLTVTVTVERYIAVCHPLRARSWCTCGRGRIAIVIIGLLSMLYNVPRFLEVDHCVYYDKQSNESWVVMMPSELRSNKSYITWYVVTLYFIVMNFIPFTLLAILNAAIYKQVRKANKERSQLSNSQKREISLATMLMFVVAVFFIFNILAMVVNIFETLNILVDEMIRISNLLVSVNSSVNFIIYCIFGDKFKRLFQRYFYCKQICKYSAYNNSTTEADNSANYGMNTWNRESRIASAHNERAINSSGHTASIRSQQRYHTKNPNVRHGIDRSGPNESHNAAVSNYESSTNCSGNDSRWNRHSKPSFIRETCLVESEA